MKRVFALLLSFVLLLGGCTAQPKDEAVPSFSVKTDYSNYMPPEHYNPAFGGIGVTELIPREDYGAIYPFVGESYESLWVNLWGFVDESGTVIVDPVYPFVEYRGGKDGGVWALGKMIGEDANDYSYPEYLYAAAAADGSRITEFRYVSVEVRDGLVLAGETVGAADEYGSNAFVFRYDIYDLELNLLTTSEELLKTMPELSQSLSDLSCAEGMFLLSFGQEYSEDWPGQVYYIEREGSRILGPYNRGHDFAQGYAIVDSDDRRGRSYLDKEGNFIEGEFSAGWNFVRGIALVSNYEDGRFTCDAIIDETGKMLLACDYGESISIIDDCIVYEKDWDVGLTAYYTFEGELLYPQWKQDGYEGHFPSTWKHLGNGFFHDREKGEIRNILDGKLYLEGSNLEVFPMDELPYFVITLGDEQRVYNLQMEEVMAVTEPWHSYRTDPFTGESYFCIEPLEEGLLQIFNKDMKLCFEMPWEPYYCSWEIYDGRVMYQNEQGCRYFDMEGNVLFDYPFVSNDR